MSKIFHSIDGDVTTKTNKNNIISLETISANKLQRGNVTNDIRITSKHTSTNDQLAVRVVTLNCWGLWIGASRRKERINAIASYLRSNSFDIVFLQEVWMESDFECIRENTKDSYKFAHLFRSGSILGSSGIVIMCKWMPKVVHFEPYSLNGSPFYPWHGDWFSGKGVAYVRVDIDSLSLHLFSTHMHAYYHEDEPLQYQYSIHRICQSYQLARFINFIADTACNRLTDSSDLFIVAGDMNSTSSELPYKVLMSHAGLTDCFKLPKTFNLNKNIIHKHKSILREQSTVDSSNSISSSSGFSDANSIFIGTKSSDSGDYHSAKTDSILLESDYTDDEDMTYCHPRNTFTPHYIKLKNSKLMNNNSTIGEEDSVDQALQLGTAMKVSKKRNKTHKIRVLRSPKKRIDFILCRLLSGGHCLVDRLPTRENKSEVSLSDHEPVTVELRVGNFLTKQGNSFNQINAFNENVPKSMINSNVQESINEQIDQNKQINETNDHWLSKSVPVNLASSENNVLVMEETQNILTQYYKTNRIAKRQLFCISIVILLLTLTVASYYAISNKLITIVSVILMWFAASSIYMICLTIGYLSYRFERNAIEAILNDISCKIYVTKNYEEQTFL